MFSLNYLICLIAGIGVTVDPELSTVVAHCKATGHQFDATPSHYTVVLELDAASRRPSKARFVMPLSALFTGKPKRDGEMHHWLDDTDFPSLEFDLSGLAEREQGLIALGTVQLHGVNAEVEIPIDLHVIGSDVHLSGTFVLDTRRFELPVIKKFGFLKVDPELTVAFDLRGQISVPEAVR